MEIGNWEKPESLLCLLIKSAGSGQSEPWSLQEASRRSTKALPVTLPDQQHAYFIADNEEAAMKCAMITCVPFSHPSHVPQILACLRQQALLNALLSSCIRPRSAADPSAATLTFEVNAVSLDHMSVSFEHPLAEQLCTADLDLSSNATSLQCRLYGTGEEASTTDEYATKVLQRCLSIPVTMRSILRQVPVPVASETFFCRRPRCRGMGRAAKSNGVIETTA